MIGREYPATTAAVLYQAMTIITVSIVKGIFVAIAAPIVTFATQQSAWDAVMNVHPAVIIFAGIA